MFHASWSKKTQENFQYISVNENKMKIICESILFYLAHTFLSLAYIASHFIFIYNSLSLSLSVCVLCVYSQTRMGSIGGEVLSL